MKIIFLDIDGVMNSERYYRSVDRTVNNWCRFDPSAVDMIAKLVQDFSAKLVISSTWRFGAIKHLDNELTKSELKKHLHKEWKTPQVFPSHRGKEIKMWLDEHPDIKDFVILDDDRDVLDEYKSRFVKTDYYDGLQAEHYYKAREILEVKTVE